MDILSDYAYTRSNRTFIKEIAGHKLSDSVIDRLPTLCTLSPGQRISYSEVVAFHNVIRGTLISGDRSKSLLTVCQHLLEMDMVERYSTPSIVTHDPYQYFSVKDNS